jgi:ParB-like chromosome segregation protein Spo0J
MDNPNELTDQQMHALCVSMEKFGFLHPIIVDKNTNLISDGHHRVLIITLFVTAVSSTS